MDYQLTQTGEQTQNLLDKVPTIETNLNAEILRSTNKDEELETAIGNEKTRAEGAEGALETAIGNEKTRAEGAELALAGDIEDNATAIGNEKTRAEGAEGTLQENIEAEATARENADDALQDGIDGINGKIPNAASSSNQLADKAFVNSSIATNTADFKGTYNSLEQLEQVSANANDYGFVVSVDSAGNTVYNRYKYVDGTGWMFEYALNNSSFTAAQWAAIQSGITSLLVAKLADLPTVAQLTTQLNQIIASVTAEKTRAEGAEAALAGDIADLDTAIGNEKTRAEGAESVLREDIADNALAIATEKTRAEGAEGTLQTAVNNEKTRAEGAELTLQQNINAEATLRDNADDTLQANIDAINAKIPSAASSSNQLADKAFVNSSISTNTAEFKGTYNSLAELQAVTGANANDYGFVIATDAAGNTVYNRYKYVEGTGWVFEYALNNSSFTSEQWAAINSGITALLVAKLAGLPTIDGLNAMFAAITSVIPSAATSSNKLVDYAQMVAALATKQNTLTFDETPTAGSDNPVKSKGILAAINAAIAPLATQADLTTLAGRVTTAESNIASLTGRVSTNEADIAALRAIYNALQQSAPQIIQPSDTWPVANPSGTVIYRVVDRVNTPPEYYSDYMWNGTTMVFMATYNNAIDDVPTAGSNNLVKSGGVAKEIYNDILAAANYKFDTTKTSAAALGDVVYFGSNVPITNGKDYIVFIKSSVEVAVSGGNIALLDGDTKISEQYNFSTSDLRNGVYFKITATATAATNGRARIWQYDGFPAGIYTFMIAEYGGQYDKIYNSIDSIHDDIRDINIQSSPEYVTVYSSQHANECVIGSNLKIHSGKKYLIYIISSVSYTPQNVRLVTNNGSTVIGRSSEPLGLDFQNGQFVEIVATGSSDNADVRCWGAAPAGEYRMRIAEIGDNFIQRFDDIESEIVRLERSISLNKAQNYLKLYDLVQSGSNVITNDLVVLPEYGITVSVVLPVGKEIKIYGYNLTSSAVGGTPTKQATCINGNTFDFETCYAYKVEFLNTTLADAMQMIENKEFLLIFYGERTTIIERNAHREPVVRAIGYERIHINGDDQYDNKHLSKLPLFVHVTDVHGDAQRLLNAYNFADFIGAKYVINTGDTVIGDYANRQKFAEEIDSGFDIPTLNTIGNHDANGSNSNQNLYVSCVQYYKNRWGYTTNGEPYYYKDDSNLKIRFITINDYDGGYYGGGGRISQEQFDWFVSALASTPADYGVILIQHMCCVTSDRVTAIEQNFNSLYYNDWCSYYGNIIMALIDAFITKQSTTLEFTREYPDRETESYSVSADFTNLNSGVEFICHVCGHSHADCIGYLPSTQRQLNITSTLTNCLYGKKIHPEDEGTFAEIDELPRDTIGVIQDSINIFAIDRNKKEVRIAKIGSNFTQTLKTRDYVIASYVGNNL